MNAQRKAARAKISRCALMSDYDRLVRRLMLTPRQRRILDLIYFQDKSALEIAEEIGYSERTVNREHQAILEKVLTIWKEESSH